MLLLLSSAYVAPAGDLYELRRRYEAEIDADDEEVICALLASLTATGQQVDAPEQ